MTVQLSNDQFEKLLAKISTARTGSFTTCHYTYDGRKNTESVEAFLTAVSVFKHITRMTDQAALYEIPLLLKEDAGIWWQVVKSSIGSWDEFRDEFRLQFAPKRETYLIYADIVQVKQGHDIPTDEFIRNKRILFAQLPGPAHTESQQLDMIYGSLRLEIRDKIPRHSIKTFEELITLAREAEYIIKEKSLISEKPQRNSTNAKVAFRRIKRSKCCHCKNFGHTIKHCKMLTFHKNVPKEVIKMTTVETSTQCPSPSVPKFKCYGCGAPGIVRSKCPTCHANRRLQPMPELGFNAIGISTDAQ